MLVAYLKTLNSRRSFCGMQVNNGQTLTVPETVYPIGQKIIIWRSFGLEGLSVNQLVYKGAW